jgi:hypothetical protein
MVVSEFSVSGNVTMQVEPGSELAILDDRGQLATATMIQHGSDLHLNVGDGGPLIVLRDYFNGALAGQPAPIAALGIDGALTSDFSNYLARYAGVSNLPEGLLPAGGLDSGSGEFPTGGAFLPSGGSGSTPSGFTLMRYLDTSYIAFQGSSAPAQDSPLP